MSLNTKKSKLCIACQACCKVFYVPTRVKSKEEMELYKLRGCKVANFKGNQVIIVPLHCPQLTPQGCRIYGNRPDVCKAYDGTKDPLMKHKCLWIKSNQGVLRKGTPRVKEV